MQDKWRQGLDFIYKEDFLLHVTVVTQCMCWFLSLSFISS